MNESTGGLKSPPWEFNVDGEIRRIGVELEVGGLELEEIAGLVADHLGLRKVPGGRYDYRLEGDAAGEWVVELDFALLKKLGRESYDNATISGEISRSAEDVLATAARVVVPVEIVSPPLPMTRLAEVEALIEALRRAGTRGTSDRLVNAFGMQFNPEVPGEDPRLLTAFVKSFLCLYDWLLARAKVDLTRRLTSYIDPFPTHYVRKVVDPHYRPDLATLIDDYLLDNATRNRALDLLPLFLYLDPPRVRRIVADPLIKSRPTFHYRLPNCDIHNPDWGLYQAWNDWVEVELLAADEDRLTACCAAYSEFLSHPLDRWLGDWKQELETRWLARSSQ